MGLYGAVLGLIWACHLGCYGPLCWWGWSSMLVRRPAMAASLGLLWDSHGAPMGLPWGSHGAPMGLPRGSYGALMGLSRGTHWDLMGLSWGFNGFSWGSHGASMGLSLSFHVAPNGAVMELLCGLYGPPVWVVWEYGYVGCILEVAPLGSWGGEISQTTSWDVQEVPRGS